MPKFKFVMVSFFSYTLHILLEILNIFKKETAPYSNFISFNKFRIFLLPKSKRKEILREITHEILFLKSYYLLTSRI